MVNTPIISKVLKSTIGKTCTLYLDSSFTMISAVILDVDEMWVKFSYTDKKKGNCIKIVKISRIYEISDLKEDL